MQKLFSLFVLFFSIAITAQVKGKVTDIKNEPLSFVSIYLNGTVTGTTSNDNGNYVLEINKKGTYSIVFQYLGYKTLKKEVKINSLPFELNVVLEEEKVEFA